MGFGGRTVKAFHNSSSNMSLNFGLDSCQRQASTDNPVGTWPFKLWSPRWVDKMLTTSVRCMVVVLRNWPALTRACPTRH